MLRRVWRYRHLLLCLTRSQYKIRFRQSSVGILWAVLAPLATLGVAVIVFGRVVDVNTGGVPYALFAVAALPAWTFFANSLTFAIPILSSYPIVLHRLSFPRATIPLSMIGASLIDLVIAFAIYAVFAYTIGSGLPVTALWLPVLVIIELAFIVGVVLLGSALNVFARDVRLAVPLVVQLLLFLTPVMYPLNSVSTLRGWLLLNPMTGIVESFRDVLVFGVPPEPTLLGPTLVGTVLALALGGWYFAGTEQRFADVI